VKGNSSFLATYRRSTATSAAHLRLISSNATTKSDFRLPITADEVAMAEEANEGCPSESIGNDGG
jgi:ferredoxin